MALHRDNCIIDGLKKNMAYENKRKPFIPCNDLHDDRLSVGSTQVWCEMPRSGAPGE